MKTRLAHSLGLGKRTQAPQVQREPTKKALLVAINYDANNVAPNVEKLGFGPLKAAREDAIAFHNLLINRYEYKTENIVLMLDTSEDPRLLPTKGNLQRQLSKLVADAQPGDQFTFWFAGHSDQVKNRTGSEADGMDEQLVTLNGKIIDNELNKRLVRRLPAGARLTAIFDTCHSGTMLDLPHYECNRIYSPWESTGKRRGEHTKWETTKRRNASVPRVSMPSQSSSLPRRATDQSLSLVTVTVMEKEKEQPAKKKSEPHKLKSWYWPPLKFEKLLPKRELRAVSMGRRNPTIPLSSMPAPALPRPRTDLSILTVTFTREVDGKDGKNKRPVLRKSIFKLKSKPNLSPLDLSKIVRWIPGRRPPSMSRTPSLMQISMGALNPSVEPTDMDKEAQMCLSPEPVPGYECSGDCPLTPPSTSVADVVSLAACNDTQVAWEAIDQEKWPSMTKYLISLLEKDPHPKYYKLLEQMNWYLHASSLQVQKRSKEVNQKWRDHKKKYPEQPASQAERTLIRDFQDFQLGSQRRLNLQEETFAL